MSTPTQVEAAIVSIMGAVREYGRQMLDAGMDQASDFRDRNMNGDEKEDDAQEQIAGIEAVIRALATDKQPKR